MNIPVTLPDWVPWWVPMLLLVPTLLYVLAFLFMPFSVLGVKTRLEVIEARLEDLQQQLRLIARHTPGGPEEMDFEDVYAPVSQARRQEPVVSNRPPIPPPVQDLYDDESDERPAPPSIARPGWRQEPVVSRTSRAEPKLDRRR